MPSSIATAIKKHRTAHQLSQRQLAELIGTTNSAISLWENASRQPRPRYRARLERVFGLATGALAQR